MADLEPSEFLQNIRELGEKREREDEARVRRLEAQILQDKSEREARRAERARSISPQKRSSPRTPQSLAGTPPSTSLPRSPRSPAKSNSAEGAPLGETTESSFAIGTTLNESAQTSPLQSLPAMPSPTSDTSQPLTGSAASLGRSGTLTWNRRPKSGERSRPLSGLGRNTPSLPSPSKLPEEAQDEGQGQGTSRSAIAQSLGAKDPSWFRQTADRGVGSVAYRRSQEDSTSSDDIVSGRRGLPGLSRESTAEPEKDASSPSGSVRSTSPSRLGSVRGSTWGKINSSQASQPADGPFEGRTPISSMRMPKFEPPQQNESNSVQEDESSISRSSFVMSPSQGRIAPERPASPTKGVGGFVQSAMMKRSDSVNKRWSAQPGSVGLSRHNSTASNRSGYGGNTLAGTNSLPSVEGRPTSLSRGNSTEPASRPTSSHSNISELTQRGDNLTRNNDGFVKPSLPLHARGKSVSEAAATDPITSPPSSPTKRFSPTKSSWLESALNKPESPKPKTAATEQPSWMVELNKAKQQRTSTNLTEKGASDKDIESFDALLNSRPNSPTKRQQAFSEPISSLQPKVETPSKPSEPEEPNASPREEEQSVANKSEPPSKQGSFGAESEVNLINDKPAPPPPTKPKPADSPGLLRSSLTSPSSQETTKPKPDTPPKKDFRSTLKARQPPAESAGKGEPEFKNVFGKLRKAETKNYVAPDELKNNILRGKAGLTITGGPQRRERRDELKEDLMKQKEVMKQKAAEEAVSGRKDSLSEKPAAEVPEALRRRNNLSRSGSSVGTLPGSPATPSPSKAKSPPPASRSASAIDGELQETTTSPPATETTSRLAGGTSKLAARFNPGLANVLARGPSPISNGADPTERGSKSALGGQTAENDEAVEPSSSAPLTHMTKGRARGPKRRAPKSAPVEGDEVAPSSTAETRPAKEGEVSSGLPTPKTPSETRVSSAVPIAQLVKPKDILPSSPASADIDIKSKMVPIVDANSMVRSVQVADGERSVFPKKSPLAELVAAKARGERPEDVKPPLQSSGLLNDATVYQEKEEKPNVGKSIQADSSPTKAEVRGPRSPNKPFEASESRYQRPVEADRTSTPASVKDFASRWNRQDSTASPTVTRARSPIKLPTKVDEQNAMRDAGLVRDLSPTKQPIGLGLGGMPQSPAATVTKSTVEPEPASRHKYPMSPPASTDLSKTAEPIPTTDPKRSTSTSTVTPSASRQSSTNIPPPSPIPDTTAATETFKSFFGTCPSRTEPLDIDTASILSTRPLNPKLKTIRTSIHALDPSNGTLTPLTPHDQHVLYTGELFLCTHVATDTTTTGAKPSNTTYFWLGADVPPATTNAALPFARKKAKDDNATLVLVAQNKEPAPFLDALGGILITRLGTRAAPLASQYHDGRSGDGTYMLCTRRHAAHVVFDEVPLSRGSFCSGFAFLVLGAPGGRTFLWKGSGAGVEECGAAKLTAMTLGGAGEMMDVDEGREPREFHQVFFAAGDPVRNVARSAEHWKQKRRCEERYAVRLFRVETPQPQSQQQQGNARPSSSSSSGGGVGTGRVGSWMGSWGAGFGRRPSQQDEGEEGESRPGSPGKQRPGTITGDGKVRITEVAPFCQRDLVDAKEAVWVLDAFFEVYVILGPQSNKHPSLLPTALLFAQDYSILAASLEDRPFVPVGNVLMPGFFPRDLKAVFRGWRDSITESFKEGRTEGKKVLGLGAAIAAVRQ
ncbi:MAG: hypothetical protein M1822_009395 [Bathelium mastoideum]|nr:MAG: hypothetical protein M1822_009395 [Bathelium mastoideum]